LLRLFFDYTESAATILFGHVTKERHIHPPSRRARKLDQSGFTVGSSRLVSFGGERLSSTGPRPTGNEIDGMNFAPLEARGDRDA
jgi:hypothetical protein